VVHSLNQRKKAVRFACQLQARWATAATPGRWQARRLCHTGGGRTLIILALTISSSRQLRFVRQKTIMTDHPEMWAGGPTLKVTW